MSSEPPQRKMRKEPTFRGRATPRPFLVPLPENMDEVAEDDALNLEAGDPEAIMQGSSIDHSATTSPAKHPPAVTGRSRKSVHSQAGFEPGKKCRSTSASRPAHPPVAEDLDAPKSGTSGASGEQGPAVKNTGPPSLGGRPTSGQQQRSRLEAPRRSGARIGSGAAPCVSQKPLSPGNRSSQQAALQMHVTGKWKHKFLALRAFVECSVEEEGVEDKKCATSAATLGGLPKHDHPEEIKGGPSGSSRLHMPPDGLEAQGAQLVDLPSTSRGHPSSLQNEATSQEVAGGAESATKKKKKKLYMAVQVYQPEGMERTKRDINTFDVFLTAAMEVIDSEIDNCQSEVGRQVLQAYKDNIIKETIPYIMGCQAYTNCPHEVDEERCKLRALRKQIEKIGKRLVWYFRENSLDIDPYQFLLDEEDE